MARTTVPVKDRKQSYSVSLTRGQRAEFVRLGSSKWLQASLAKTMRARKQAADTKES